MDVATHRTETRSRIVEVAAELLREHGPTAVTTRRVADGAAVQAPTIYRLFGDKDGLLDAVAEHVMATYVSAKAETVRTASRNSVDPIEDLRRGWDTQIDFGVANPTLFALLSNPDRGTRSAAALFGLNVLAARVRRIATTGRLRVSESRAVDMIHAAGTGTVLTILATAPEQRHPDFATDMFDAVLNRILVDAPEASGSDIASAATALRASADDLDALTDAERRLMNEWLDRIVSRQ